MIDITKQYRTRDGREVRLYASDGDGIHSVHGAIKYDTGWYLESWDAEGSYHYPGSKHELDLIEVKPRIKRNVWLNMMPEHEILASAIIYKTEEEAKAWRHPATIACIKVEIDCEEGEGL